MKKNILLIVAVLAGLLETNYSHARQSVSYEGDITITPIRLEQRGEVLHIDIDIIMYNMKVKSAQGVDLTPQLVSSDRTINLPKVSIKGHDEYLAYERVLSLMTKKEKEEYQEPYRVEKSNERNSYTIEYRYILPYEEWMKHARLDMQRDECGCGLTELMIVEPVVEKVTLETIPVPYNVIPHMAYVQPVAEQIKAREKEMECFLDFEVNKVYIRPEYMNNPRELAKIREMIDELKSDPSIAINELDIIGYASPEGSLENNRWLSENRAMALRDYLASRYEFPRSIYHISFGGENWEGLRKALATLDVDYKTEVLDIIDHVSVEQGRKTRLMQLRGGAPYSYLLKYIYPSLRVAICKVKYNIKNFNVDEAKEMIKTRPQNLSLNEMFLVANTYPKGSQEFIDVFETAVRMYPDDDIANLNAAASALLRNDIASAERYFNRIKSQKDLPEYYNTAGVLALMKGNFESAEKHLESAASSNLEVAKQNLEELAKKKTNIQELKSKQQFDNR